MHAIELCPDISKIRGRRGLIRKTFLSSLQNLRKKLLSCQQRIQDEYVHSRPKKTFATRRAEVWVNQTLSLVRTPRSPTPSIESICTRDDTPEVAINCRLDLLPPELLLQILLHLPTIDYHSLKQTTPHLSDSISTHSAYLINTLIRRSFGASAAVLSTVLATPPSKESSIHHFSHSTSGINKSTASIVSMANSHSPSTSSLDPSPATFLTHLPQYQQLLPAHSSVQLEESLLLSNTPESLRPSIRLITAPGPAYLEFLRDYALEIEVFWELYGPKCQHCARCKRRLSCSCHKTCSKNFSCAAEGHSKSRAVHEYECNRCMEVSSLRAQDGGCGVGAIVSKRCLGDAEAFGQMVQTYCVRPFLRRLNDCRLREMALGVGIACRFADGGATEWNGAREIYVVSEVMGDLGERLRWWSG